MPNGSGLKSGISSTQSAVIVKKPLSNSLYYIFSAECNTCGNPNAGGLHYSVIDITANGGYGDVVQKNIELLKDSSHEKLVVVKNALGCGYWIVTHDTRNGTYYSFHLNSGGVDHKPVKSKIGYKSSQVMQQPGYLKASRSGSKLAAAFTFAFRLELFDFNNLTGVVSNCQVLDSSQTLFYGLSFSLSEKYLYATDGSSLSGLYQYDVSLPDRSLIFQSKTTIKTDPRRSGSYLYGGLQQGPDGKIYLSKNVDTSLLKSYYIGAIQYPDNKGLACSYNDSAILISTIPTKRPHLGLPNLIESIRPFKLEFELGKDTVLCIGSPYEINGAKNIDGSFLWNTGDTAKTITVNSDGMYKLTVSSLCGTYSDSVTVRVGKPFIVYLGSDTAFCGRFNHLLDAKKGGKSYLWNTGDTTVSILVDKPNMYSVVVKDSLSCKTGDTITIDQVKEPIIDLQFDTVTCKYVTISILNPDSSVKYLWNTGDTVHKITISKKGSYTVTLKNRFCSLNSIINVEKLPKPDIELGPDTSICEGKPIFLNAGDDAEKYFWNTKDTTKQIIVFKEGLYSITVSRNNCRNQDSIWVGPVCDMWYYIPNVFTPNHDNKNDVFEVTGQYMKYISINIYTRWGEHIYFADELQPWWDGTFKTQQCPDGVYMYLITIEGYRNGIYRKEHLRGNVSLIR